ncbi:hypothetical protein [Pseudomonas sp. YL-218 TE3947]|uniref:hypothetical protein n=1 Tax=Pseudomonas TaxID=286 RepID=UPI003D19E732
MPEISPCASSANQGFGRNGNTSRHAKCKMQNAKCKKGLLQDLHFANTTDGGFALAEDGSENAAHPFSIR